MLRKKKPPVLRGRQKKRAQTEKIKNGEKEKNQNKTKQKQTNKQTNKKTNQEKKKQQKLFYLGVSKATIHIYSGREMRSLHLHYIENCLLKARSFRDVVSPYFSLRRLHKN